MRSVILGAATKHFGAEGRVEVLRLTAPDKNGIYSASVKVTTPTAVLYYTAWSDAWAVGFVADRTEPLAGLPLFETV